MSQSVAYAAKYAKIWIDKVRQRRDERAMRQQNNQDEFAVWKLINE